MPLSMLLLLLLSLSTEVEPSADADSWAPSSVMWREMSEAFGECLVSIVVVIVVDPPTAAGRSRGGGEEGGGVRGGGSDGGAIFGGTVFGGAVFGGPLTIGIGLLPTAEGGGAAEGEPMGRRGGTCGSGALGNACFGALEPAAAAAVVAVAVGGDPATEGAAGCGGSEGDRFEGSGDCCCGWPKGLGRECFGGKDGGLGPNFGATTLTLGTAGSSKDCCTSLEDEEADSAPLTVAAAASTTTPFESSVDGSGEALDGVGSGRIVCTEGGRVFLTPAASRASPLEDTGGTGNLRVASLGGPAACFGRAGLVGGIVGACMEPETGRLRRELREVRGGGIGRSEAGGATCPAVAPVSVNSLGKGFKAGESSIDTSSCPMCACPVELIESKTETSDTTDKPIEARFNAQHRQNTTHRVRIG